MNSTAAQPDWGGWKDDDDDDAVAESESVSVWLRCSGGFGRKQISCWILSFPSDQVIFCFLLLCLKRPDPDQADPVRMIREDPPDQIRHHGNRFNVWSDFCSRTRTGSEPEDMWRSLKSKQGIIIIIIIIVVHLYYWKLQCFYEWPPEGIRVKIRRQRRPWIRPLAERRWTWKRHWSAHQLIINWFS